SEYESAFWVSIEVIEPNRAYAFDFALSLCTAEWESEVSNLPCPGSTDSSDGFVRLLENPDLELRSENEPALWVHPNDERYGWIEGQYPEFKIETGD
ncbi:MAG: hypothetical protein GWN00_05015, partial [Aliifodinibius sp.]|nr:hypothetical protein [candidate division Zixibacteria bacterium]NIT55605.1 hypothetical protein [Fodinibius sp.]NIW43842.1 hypothetical protein [Gammaproteobacteria bacterium]NIY24189.1 hypothetical protein [Fodinibius sp.]